MSSPSCLRIGVVSDVQAYPYDGDWGLFNLRKALKMLAARRIDVLLMAGDLGDVADAVPGCAEFWRKLVGEAFPEWMPKVIVCDGNHDRYRPARRDDRATFGDFCRAFALPMDNPRHEVVQGYDFFTLSTEDLENYGEAALAELDRQLAAAERRAPGKPLFVMTHYPPAETMIGSSTGGSAGLRAVLARHPAVISLSGHTHHPLEDERSIWQGEFTAVTTATLSYGCMHGPVRYENCAGPIMPFAREALGMLILEVRPDAAEITRLHVADDREIAPERRWRWSLPYCPEAASYAPERRRKAAVPPEFPPGARVLLRYDYGFAYFAVDAARHPDCVVSYRLNIAEIADDGTAAPLGDVHYVADFYRRERYRAERQFFRLPGRMLTPGRSYRFRVYPVEAFGQEGAPAELTARIPETYRFRPDPPPMPQE